MNKIVLGLFLLTLSKLTSAETGFRLVEWDTLEKDANLIARVYLAFPEAGSPQKLRVVFAVCADGEPDSAPCGSSGLWTEMPVETYLQKVGDRLELGEFEKLTKDIQTKEDSINRFRNLLKDRAEGEEIAGAEKEKIEAELLKMVTEVDALYEKRTEGEERNKVKRKIQTLLVNQDRDPASAGAYLSGTDEPFYTAAMAPFLEWREANLCQCRPAKPKEVADVYKCVLSKGNRVLAAKEDDHCNNRTACAEGHWVRGANYTALAEVVRSHCAGYYLIGSSKRVPTKEKPKN